MRRNSVVDQASNGGLAKRKIGGGQNQDRQLCEVRRDEIESLKDCTSRMVNCRGGSISFVQPWLLLAKS